MKIDRRFVLPVGALAAGGLGALLIVLTRPAAEVQPPASVAPLVRAINTSLGSYRHRVRTQGTVAPRTESDLMPEVAGRVTWASPSLVSGGFFDRDEVLLQLDSRDYEAALERARASVTRAESQLVLAQKELERQRSLAGRSVASQANLDLASNAERVAEASLQEARAARSQAERDLARTQIRAPFDGRVRSESVDVGQFVNRGAPVARLYAVDYAEVRLPVPDAQLAYLDIPLGERPADSQAALAKVTLRAKFAGAARRWTGEIVRTEGEIDSGTRMIYVVARVDDPYRRKTGQEDSPSVPLAVGLFVEAEIEGREEQGGVVGPREALRDGDRVFVIDEASRLRFRSVQVLRRLRGEVVIGRGLVEGERVCISPLATPVDGMRVRLGEAPS